jgi:hypothetical protein
MPTSWHNSDGLFIKFGNDKGATTDAGNYNVGGAYNVLEFKITGTDLTSTAAIMSDVVWLPDNCRVDQVEIVAETLMNSAGNAATLDIGLIKKDRSTAAGGGDDGLVAALPEASMDPAGDWQEIRVGHTYVGADVGTTISDGPAYITANYNGEAFTAGVIRVRIFYRQMS